MGTYEKIKADAILAEEKEQRERFQQVHAPPVVERKPFEEKDLNFGPNLTPEQKQQLMTVINDHRDVFAKDDTELEAILYRPVVINTGDNPPVYIRQYPYPPWGQQEIQMQAEYFLKHDIIEPSTSEYNFPVLLVKKSNGDYQILSRSTWVK